MAMDKRSIMGFLLILAVLILWPFWNKLLNPPQEPPPVEQSQPGVMPADTGRPPESGAAERVVESAVRETDQTVAAPVAQEPQESERLITIETPNYSAVF
jgi:YidC/Oxa1 family membrane protein insertase